MNITNYIINDLKPFTLKDALKSAQKLCKNFPITHIIVVEDKKLIGSFAESDLQIIDKKNEKISNYTHLLEFFFADKNTSILELLKLFADNDCNIIPVLNEDKNYIGYYSLTDILRTFANTPFLFDQGSVLIVEKNEKDFSMSEISQIIETTKATLMGLYISEKSTDFVTVTLKIFAEDINEIIQTFRRYDYYVLTKHKDDVYLKDLKDRTEYLQKYLKM